MAQIIRVIAVLEAEIEVCLLSLATCGHSVPTMLIKRERLLGSLVLSRGNSTIFTFVRRRRRGKVVL